MTDLTGAAQPSSHGCDDEPPLAIVLNARSGHEAARARVATIRALLEAANRPHRLLTLDRPAELRQRIEQALEWARQHRGAVVAAGGDGTINAVAQAVVPAGCPLGILPQGTFNYFGRAHGIPTDTEVAMRLLLRAQPRPIQVGLLNGRIFLVNASIGLYSELLEERETFKRRLGRSRFTAAVAGLWTLLRTQREWLIELEAAGDVVNTRTSTLFVGNNRLQLEQLGLPEQHELARGVLAAVMVKPIGRLAMLGLALRGALGRLGDADNIVHFAFTKLTVTPRPRRAVRRIKVAMDGEVLRLSTPLVFSVHPKPLWLLLPPDSTP